MLYSGQSYLFVENETIASLLQRITVAGRVILPSEDLDLAGTLPAGLTEPIRISSHGDFVALDTANNDTQRFYSSLLHCNETTLVCQSLFQTQGMQAPTFSTISSRYFVQASYHVEASRLLINVYLLPNVTANNFTGQTVF
jgi:hypothetical protein